jgi:hypothetical protein
MRLFSENFSLISLFLKYKSRIMRLPRCVRVYYGTISLCLHVNPPLVVRQRFGKDITAATNTHVTTEEMLD